MSDLETNKKLVTEFFRAYGALDFPALMKTISDDIVFNVMGAGCFSGQYTLQTVSGVAEIISAVCPGGVKLQILDITAEDDRVACRVSGLGEVSGGGVYDNNYHFLLKIRNGKIQECFEYMDTLLVERIFAPLAKQRKQNNS